MKKTFTRILAIVLCLAMLFVCAAGCGEKDTESKKTDSKQENEGVTETKVSKEFLDSLKGMSITIAYPDKWRVAGTNPIDDEWAININEVAKDLGITITEKYLTNKANGNTFITESLAGNNSGNILGVHGGALFRGVQSKAWAPLTNAVKTVGINFDNKYYSKYGNSFNEVDNDLYGITFNGCNYADFTALYYNVNMVTVDAKLEDPLDLYNKGEWTFDKFEEYCKKLTKKDSSGKITTYGCQLAANASLAQFVKSNGGAIGRVDETGKWYQSMSEPKTVKALDYLYKWLYRDPCVYVPSGAWGTAFINLYEGTAAMAMGSYYCATNSYMKFTDEGGIGMVPLPQGPDGSKEDLFKIDGGSAYVIPTAYAKDAAKYVYIIDRIGAKWYDRFESVYSKQMAAIFYEDKYYDLFMSLTDGSAITGFNEDSCSLVSDSTGYSVTHLCLAMQKGVSPSTAVGQFATPMQNEQNDKQGKTLFTGLAKFVHNK